MSFKSILVTTLFLSTGVCVQAMQQDQGTIHYAAIRGDVDAVQQFINQGLINQQGTDGWTPLHWAAYGGHEEVVRLLLIHGTDPRISNQNGNTTLHCPLVQKILAEIQRMRAAQHTILMGLHQRAGARSPLQVINHDNIRQIFSYLQPEFFPAAQPVAAVATPTMTQRVLAAAQNMLGNPRSLAAITSVAVVGFATLRLFNR